MRNVRASVRTSGHVHARVARDRVSATWAGANTHTLARACALAVVRTDARLPRSPRTCALRCLAHVPHRGRHAARPSRQQLGAYRSAVESLLGLEPDRVTAQVVAVTPSGAVQLLDVD